MVKKQEQTTDKPENIKQRGILQEMRESYLAYAMSVIVSRALPDIRDGLKPVQRRILYAMNELGLRHNVKTVKSARVTGEVIGKFHPHGDMAVYDALVRMAQPFSLRYPLVVGQGNFGSQDGDPPAAMRYTEAKLSQAAEELLLDIDKNTVEFRPNYDNTLKEPVVLPAKIPNLLINGSMGIAVGMATNIPPHNLSEVVGAMQYFLKNPKATTEELFKIVKGPDFPTGGIIYDKDQMLSAYSTGKGSVLVRGKAEILPRQGRGATRPHQDSSETKKEGAYDIVITEIPYEVNKATMISRIAELVESKKIDGIKDVRDESDKDGLRVIVELKPQAQAQRILNRLFKFTDLQKAFHLNMVALIDGIQPKTLSLKEFLDEFLKHRKNVVLRRTEFDLQKTKDRIHILEGLAIALEHIDEIIALIRKSSDKNNAKENLMKKFKLSDKQSEAILAIRLESLARLEGERVYAELKEKRKLALNLGEILDSPKKVVSVVDAELSEINQKYGDKRRTLIVSEAVQDFKEEELIKEEQAIITLSQEDYIRRINPESFRMQKRGGKGVAGFETKSTEDIPRLVRSCSTHDLLLFFTNTGKLFYVKAYEIPESGRLSRGKPINNFLNISGEEKIVSFIPYHEKQTQFQYLNLVTKQGLAKKVKLSDILGKNKRNGSRIIGLQKNDGVVATGFSSGKDNVILVAKSGQLISFPETDLRIQGKAAKGVRAMGLKKEDEIVSLGIANKESFKTQRLLVIMKNGYGKMSLIKDFRLQKRGGSGVKSANVNEKTGAMIMAKVINEEQDLVIISTSGQALKLDLASVPVIGRGTQGVRLIKLDKDDKVAAAAVALASAKARLNPWFASPSTSSGHRAGKLAGFRLKPTSQTFYNLVTQLL